MEMSQVFVKALLVIVFYIAVCANARPAAVISDDDVIVLTKLVSPDVHIR